MIGERAWRSLILAAALCITVHLAAYDFVHQHANATELQLQVDLAAFVVGAFVGAMTATRT